MGINLFDSGLQISLLVIHFSFFFSDVYIILKENMTNSIIIIN